MGGIKCVLILMLELLLTLLIVRGNPSLSIDPATWYTGTTLKVTCNLTGITTSGMVFFKGTDQIYTCPLTNKPCSDKYGLSDYSDVDWAQTGKPVFTISKANSTRDDGDWTCSGDDITQKSMETSLNIRDADCGPLEIDNGRVTYTKTTYGYTAKYICYYGIEGNDTRICQANGLWSDEPTVCSVNSTCTSETTLTNTSKENSISTYASTTGVTDASTNTTHIPQIGLSEKQQIGLIAAGVGFVVVVCCSSCICAIVRRKVNKKKRRRRYERRKEVEANVHISESL